LPCRLRQRQALVNGVDVAIRRDHARQTQPTTSRILDPPLPQRVAEDVLGDAKKPGKRRRFVLDRGTDLC